ncbi:MAG: TRAP transporter small permease [Desulfopila sp.]
MNVILRFFVKILAAVASGALAVMMFLMAADVVGRYFFSSPIPGGMESTEMLMAIIVPFSIAYCAMQHSHVAVDLVVEKYPAKARFVLNYIMTLLSVGFVALIGWQNCSYIVEMYQGNLTSAVLKLPTYPFVAAVAIGMITFALVMFSQLIQGKTKE